jgi:hypothetical protein
MVVLQEIGRKQDEHGVPLPVQCMLLFQRVWRPAQPGLLHPFCLPLVAVRSSSCSGSRIRGTGSPRRFNRKQTHPSFRQPFEKAVILLDQIIEILDLPQFASLWDMSFCFEFGKRFWVGSIYVDVDHPGFAGKRDRKRCEKEALGGLSISRRTQEKLERVALRINGSIEIHPFLFDFDIRLIDCPGISSGVEVWPTAFVEFWGISLDPAVDGRVIDV